jgi:hypothetical protein
MSIVKDDRCAFARVNDNDFTVNTYFEHTEKQVCERTKEEKKD